MKVPSISRFVLVVLSAGLLLAGASVISLLGTQEFVPTVESLRHPQNPTASFIVAENGIWGVYGYMDVYSEIYQYKTSVSNAANFWQEVSKQASEDGWREVAATELFRRYQRITTCWRKGGRSSAEEVRIGYHESSKTVTIAWLPVYAADRKSPHFPGSHNVAVRFGEQVLWLKSRQHCLLLPAP